MAVTKDDIVAKYNDYTETCDDDVIRFKQKIKENLLKCPELLYALNWHEFENELFNPDGTLNEDGEWDRYFGTAIKPYMIFPDTILDTQTYVCFTVHFENLPRYNDRQYYYQISFIILCHGENAIDRNSGIPRHDLIGSIIRERFNWSNIFGTQCHLVKNTESITDSKNNFLTRTMIFQGVAPNALVNTINGSPQTINHLVRR